MRYLWLLLIPMMAFAGLKGDKPSIQSTDPLPSRDEVQSPQIYKGFDCTLFRKDMRVLKCQGLSVFEVATELINLGFCDPYTKANCGVVRLTKIGGGKKAEKGRVFFPEPVYDENNPRPRVSRSQLGGGATADTTDSGVDSLFSSCWTNFIRYMGVKNWRRISPDGPYPPFDQPGILFPVSNLVFVPNSRWENFKCATPKGKSGAGNYAGRKRRYLGTEGFILEEKRGKGEDQKYQDIIDYIDSKIAEFEGGTAEQDIQSQMRTSYQTTTGLVDNQGTYRQGAHSSNDTVTLVDGEATVNISTAVTPGRMDQSFLSSQSYRGYVTTKDTSNTNTYRLIPISGKRFRIISSDSTDTATVHFKVEGD